MKGTKLRSTTTITTTSVMIVHCNCCQGGVVGVEPPAKFSKLYIFCRISTFWGMLRNSVLAGDKRTNTAYFGRVQAAIEN